MSSLLPNPNARIAIFLPSLNGGGAERVMVSLSNAFAKRGYSVDLILAVTKGPYLSYVSKDIRIVELKVRRTVTALLPLWCYLRRERPGVLLSAMTHANLIAILAKILAGVPMRLIISERTTISLEVKKAKDFVTRFFHFLVPVLYRRADGIVAVSQASAADLIRFSNLPASAVDYIYNPFDIQHIQKLASEPLLHPWFIPEQPPVILAIGRLTEQKNFSSLINAFTRLRQRRKVRLLILGEGELRDSLESLVSKYGLTAEDVQMPGFVDNPFAYMARCGVFVLSSRWEGLPGVLIEAMACGAPVVSTDCLSGPREILEGGCWGELVRVDDDDALAKAIDKVLVTPFAQLPDVRLRAANFEIDRSVDAYLKKLGLPIWVKSPDISA